MRIALIVVDGGREDETGFTMRLAAVILPDLGTGPDVPIVVSHWFVARGDGSGRVNGWWRCWSAPPRSTFPSPVSGRLAEIRGLEDDRVEPGSVLGLVATADDDAREGGS